MSPRHHTSKFLHEVTLVCYVNACLICKNFFSPCSGLVVSGFSRQKTVDNFDATLAQAIEPYKTFKNMYIVDRTTEEFKGLRGNSIFHNSFCLIKNLILNLT